MRTRWKTVLFAIATLIAISAASLSFAAPRSAIARAAISAYLWSKGFDVRHFDLTIASDHLHVADLLVDDRNGREVASIHSIDASYGVRGRLFGLTSVDIEQPILTFHREPDGSFDVARLMGPSSTRSSAGPPLIAHLRVRDGILTLENYNAPNKLGRSIALRGIQAEATIDQSGISRGRMEAYLSGDSVNPVIVDFQENDATRIAQATARIIDAPIGPAVDLLVSSPAFSIERGTIDATLNAYALDWSAGAAASWHVDGTGVLHGARIRVMPLAVPVENVSGPFDEVDGTLIFPSLSAMAAHVPVRATGNVAILPTPRLSISVWATGPFERIRSLLAFSKQMPLHGSVGIQATIRGPAASPHAEVALSSRGAVRYGALPVNTVQGDVYYADGAVTVRDAYAIYDDTKIYGGGDIDIADTPIAGRFVALASAPSRKIPWLANIDPSGSTRALGALSGPLTQLSGEGFAAALGGPVAVRATVAADQSMMDAVVSLRDRLGGELIAADQMSRSSDHSISADMLADRFHLRISDRSVDLPGIERIPFRPPSAATELRGRITVRGTTDAPIAAVLASASRTSVGGVPLGRISMDAAGDSHRFDVKRVAVDGPLAQGYATGGFTSTAGLRDVSGSVRGALMLTLRDAAGLVDTFSGSQPIAPSTSGIAESTFEAVAAGSSWLATARFTGKHAVVFGAPVSDLSVALGADRGRLTVYAATAHAAGGQIEAQGTVAGAKAGGVTILARGIDASTIENPRWPVARGDIVAIARIRGAIDAPRVDAGATLSSGDISGRAIAGDAQVRLSRDVLTIDDARVAAGSSQVDVTGTISGLTSSDPSLALTATMPEGDLGALSAQGPAQLQAVRLGGVASADLHIGGALDAPSIDGTIAAGEGSVRGVPFSDLNARFAASPSSIDVRYGRVRFGSSPLSVAGAVSADSLRIRAASPHVDFSDFDDFFDGADVVEGTGRFDVALDISPTAEAAAGSLRARDLRVADVPVGSIDGVARPNGSGFSARLYQSGPLGRSTTNADVTSASGTDPRLNVSTDVRGVNIAAASHYLSSRLPDLGGTANAHLRVFGRTRDLSASAAFDVLDAHVGQMPIREASGFVTGNSNALLVRSLRVAVDGATVEANGRLDRQGRVAANASANISDLRAVSRMLRQPVPMRGTVAIRMSASGSARRPRVQTSFTAGQGAISDVAFDSASGTATYSSGRLAASGGVDLAGGRGSMHVTSDLPVRLSPFGIGPNDQPVFVDVRAEGAGLAFLNPFLHQKAQVYGRLDADARVSGTAGRPSLAGSARVRGATIRSQFDTIPITGLNADVALRNEAVTVSGVNAQLGKGTLKAHGEAHVVPAAGLRRTASLQYAFDSALTNADVNVPDLIKGSVNAALSLTKSGSIPYLSGNIALTNTSVPFASILALASASGSGPRGPSKIVPGLPALRPNHIIVYGGSLFGDDLDHIVRPTPRPTPPPAAQAALAILPPKFDLDMNVSAGKNVGVTGLINVTGMGTVAIGGDTNAPKLKGTLTAVRGRAGFLNANFDLLDGWLSFYPRDGFLPTVNADATTSTEVADITVSVSGRVDQLHTVFDSNPEMSQNAIMAALLHVPQINSALASSHGEQQASLGVTPQNVVSGVLAGEVFGALNTGLEQVFNLEEVDFGLDPYGNPSLELRKQVSPRAYTLYRTTFTVPASQAYGIAYQVRRALQIELTQTQAPPGPANPLGVPYSTSIQVKITFH